MASVKDVRTSALGFHRHGPLAHRRLARLVGRIAFVDPKAVPAGRRQSQNKGEQQQNRDGLGGKLGLERDVGHGRRECGR